MTIKELYIKLGLNDFYYECLKCENPVWYYKKVWLVYPFCKSCWDEK